MDFNIKVWLVISCLLVLTACAEHPSQAVISATTHQQVVTEGSAQLGQAGKAQARREAIDQAISSAARQLQGDASQNTHAMFDSKVVDEWQDGNLYHVQIVAVWSDKELCGAKYRKKILATAFPVMIPDQLSSNESQDLLGGIPREINNHLQETGEYIGRNYTHTVLYARPDLAPEILPVTNYTGSSVINLARQQDAQFVLSGVIRDFKIESGEYLRGAGFFAELRSMVRDMVSRRSIGIDVYVHDGFTGALLFQHRYTDSIVGDISLPSGYTVGSERFHDTPAGYAIEGIVQKASDDVRHFLSCFPFSSRVTQVDGRRIVIAAGAQDKVKPGDQFKIYPASNAIGAGISASDGLLTITDVNANSAQGSLEGDGQWAIRPGDWVKSTNAQ